MPRAAALDLRRVDASFWRAVEAQHIVSTMRLVQNDLDDQRALEDLIGTVKPPLPVGTQGLHWLLAAAVQGTSTCLLSMKRVHSTRWQLK